MTLLHQPQAVCCRHLSPVKDIKIFLRDTPSFSLRRFIVRNTSRPTCHIQRFYLDLDCYSAIEDMSILPELLHCCSSVLSHLHGEETSPKCAARRHPPLLVGCAQHHLEDRSSPRSSFIPPQIKDYGLGIPACLAKYHRSQHIVTAASSYPNSECYG